MAVSKSKKRGKKKEVEDTPSEEQAEIKALELKKLATEAFKIKNYVNALVLVNEAIVLQPNESSHYANRSLTNLRLNHIKDAISDAKISVQFKPSWGKAYFRLAMALREDGDVVESLKTLRRALKHDLTISEKEMVMAELVKLENEVSVSTTTSMLASTRLEETSVTSQLLPQPSPSASPLIQPQPPQPSPSASPLIQPQPPQPSLSASPLIQPPQAPMIPKSTHSRNETADIESKAPSLKSCNFNWFDTKKLSQFPLNIVTDGHGNRRLIATRNINKGDLIWKETPIASIVQQQYENKICHYCYNYSYKLNYKCSKCQSAYWCSSKCQQLHQSHSYECKICMKTKKRNKQTSALRLIMQLMFISTTNVLNLKQKVNDLQSSIGTTDTQSKQISQQSSSSNQSSRSHFETHASQILTDIMNIGPFGDLDVEEVKHLIGCVNVNSFVVTDIEGRRLGNALFGGASFFNHDCNPNAVVGFDLGTYDPGLNITVRSLDNIPKGEEVSIGYTEVYRSTYLRQRNLLASKGFKCQCSTCCPSNTPSLSSSSLSCQIVDENQKNLKNMSEEEEEERIESVFKVADKAVGLSLGASNNRKEFDTALIMIIKCFKQLNQTDNGGSGISPTHWVMFELHCLVVTLILQTPTLEISKSVAKSLTSLGERNALSQQIDLKSPRLSAIHQASFALQGSYDQLQVALHHAVLATICGVATYNQNHPRLALCRRNLGNALMLLAAKQTGVQRLEVSKAAAVEYGHSARIIDFCWGAKHPDCVTLNTLMNWAKGFS